MKKCIAVLITLLTFWSFIPAMAENDNENTNISSETKTEENLVENRGDKDLVKKSVYLTFDDGPTKNTLKILEILKKEEVKGTFFVVGELAEQYPDILIQTRDEGHEICIHTYNHKNKNYQSKAAFMNDYHKALMAVTDILGKEPSKFMRMPGGSSTHAADKYTLKAIRDELCGEGIYYVDWNVSIEDAIYSHTPVDSLIETFWRELKKSYIDPNNIIVLMHDGVSNTTTPQALPTIIKYFKKNNYEFKTFGNLSDQDFEVLLHEKQINKYNRPKQADSSEMKANPTSENKED